MKEYDFLTTPIVDIVNSIIMDAVDMNASDIHFDCSEKFLKIRTRVDGELRDYSIVDNKYKRNLITRIKLLSGMNITESRLPQDGAIKGTINGRDLDMRVSCLPTVFGEKVVIRILDYSMSIKGVETLGFTEENYNLILKMLANPNGIILVTGATGSGKSTTTYAMLQRLNSEETNIITVEDPVEMSIEGINQVQVNSEIGLDFANVLRSILRQDPNVILIGEIRDTETAQIAIRSSITGHLVLSTLHTNNSLTSIERLLDMNVERYLLSASLKGIISQNLARKLCPKCKVKRPTTEAEKRLFKKQLNIDVNEIYDHGSCSECRNGFKGRIALQEVLLINDEIRDAINDSMKRSTLRDLIYGRGVKTLLQDGLIKVSQGITSIEEVLKIVEAESDNNVYTNDDDEKKSENVNNQEKIENNNIGDNSDAVKSINNNNINLFDKMREKTIDTNNNNNNININNQTTSNTQTSVATPINSNTNTNNNINPNLTIPNYNISSTKQVNTTTSPAVNKNAPNAYTSNTQTSVATPINSNTNANNNINPNLTIPNYNISSTKQVNTTASPVVNKNAPNAYVSNTQTNTNIPINNTNTNNNINPNLTIPNYNISSTKQVNTTASPVINKNASYTYTPNTQTNTNIPINNTNNNYSNNHSNQAPGEGNRKPSDDLENTQDIFASLWGDTKQNNDSNYITMNDVAKSNTNTEDGITFNNKYDKNYTNDLLNLINQNLYNDNKN